MVAGLVDAVVRRWRKPWMADAGIIEGRPEDSSTVDEVVGGRFEP
jgi:hypothetical protein